KVHVEQDLRRHRQDGGDDQDADREQKDPAEYVAFDLVHAACALLRPATGSDTAALPARTRPRPDGSRCPPCLPERAIASSAIHPGRSSTKMDNLRQTKMVNCPRHPSGHSGPASGLAIQRENSMISPIDRRRIHGADMKRKIEITFADKPR